VTPALYPDEREWRESQEMAQNLPRPAMPLETQNGGGTGRRWISHSSQ